MLGPEDHVRGKETESRINCISTIKKAALTGCFFYAYTSEDTRKNSKFARIAKSK